MPAWMGLSDLPLKAATSTTPASRYLDEAAITQILGQFSAWPANVNGGGNSISNVVINTSLAISSSSLRAVGASCDVRVMESTSGPSFRLVSVGSGVMHMQRSADGFATLHSTPMVFNADGSVQTPDHRFMESSVVGYRFITPGSGALHLQRSTDGWSTLHSTPIIANASGVTFDGILTTGSAWNGSHHVMGSYHLWVDASGRLRIKSSAPVSDTDGTVVGTQT